MLGNNVQPYYSVYPNVSEFSGERTDHLWWKMPRPRPCFTSYFGHGWRTRYRWQSSIPVGWLNRYGAYGRNIIITRLWRHPILRLKQVARRFACYRSRSSRLNGIDCPPVKRALWSVWRKFFVLRGFVPKGSYWFLYRFQFSLVASEFVCWWYFLKNLSWTESARKKRKGGASLSKQRRLSLEMCCVGDCTNSRNSRSMSYNVQKLAKEMWEILCQVQNTYDVRRTAKGMWKELCQVNNKYDVRKTVKGIWKVYIYFARDI